MVSVLHVTILVGLAAAILAILGWMIYEVVDFIRRIYPYEDIDDNEDLR